MSIESLNSQNFSPCKDYSANRLQTGVLQLASCTNLVVDETTLNPGHLDANGNCYYCYCCLTVLTNFASHLCRSM